MGHTRHFTVITVWDCFKITTLPKISPFRIGPYQPDPWEESQRRVCRGCNGLVVVLQEICVEAEPERMSNLKER